MGLLISHNVLATELFDKEIVNADTGEGQDSEGHQSCLFDNLHYLLLGAQGPDVLSSYGLGSGIGFHPFVKHKNLSNKIHAISGNDLVKALDSELSTIADLKERNAFESWSFGFLSHYLLDNHCYPYVFYFSGFSNDGRKERYWLSRHSRLEMAIDIAMAHRYEATYFIDNPEDALPFVKSETRTIDKHFKNIINKLFNEEVSDYFYSQCVLISREKLKKSIGGITGISKITNIGKIFKGTQEISDECLNLKGDSWKDPLTGKASNESFLDLFAKAQEELHQVYEAAVINGFSSLVGTKNWPDDFFGFPPDSKLVYSNDNQEEWSRMVGK